VISSLDLKKLWVEAHAAGRNFVLIVA